MAIARFLPINLISNSMGFAVSMVGSPIRKVLIRASLLSTLPDAWVWINSSANIILRAALSFFSMASIIFTRKEITSFLSFSWEKAREGIEKSNILSKINLRNILKISFNRLENNYLPSCYHINPTITMHISEINIYPVKSLRGISLEEAIIEERGLRYDRRFMLIDENGGFMTQREFPQMATISTSIKDTGIGLSADGFGEIEILFNDIERLDGERVQSEVWGSPCEGIICNAEINEWLSGAIGEKARLLYMPDDSRRSISPKFIENDEIVSFADGYPFLLIGESTLDDLNSRLETKIPMNRFRPNIVIKGSGAYAEDKWRNIRIGEAEFRSTKPCARCVMTTIDQTNGISLGKEPLKTLAKYRLAKQIFPDNYESLHLSENAVLFGQNLVSQSTGKIIRAGDRLTVLL
jgi:uncharacterized protein